MRLNKFGKLLLVLGLISAMFHAKGQGVTANQTVIKPTSSKFKGLPISRTDLIEGLISIDSLMHFKEIAVTKGLPKFTAKGSYGARVEITGTEDNVTRAQWTVSQPASGTLNKLSFTRMAYFANILLKQEGSAWVFQQVFLYNQNPSTLITSNVLIDGYKASFFYDPTKKSFNVSISTE